MLGHTSDLISIELKEQLVVYLATENQQPPPLGERRLFLVSAFSLSLPVIQRPKRCSTTTVACIPNAGLRKHVQEIDLDLDETLDFGDNIVRSTRLK